MNKKQVAQAAFGKPGALLATSVLMVMTIFVIVAYMVLVRDIWSGIVSSVVGRVLDVEQSNHVSYLPRKYPKLRRNLACTKL